MLISNRVFDLFVSVIKKIVSCALKQSDKNLMLSDRVRWY